MSFQAPRSRRLNAHLRGLCTAAVSSAAAAAFNLRNSKPHRDQCPKRSHGSGWDPKALGFALMSFAAHMFFSVQQ
jgi:hypothetical protein